MVSTRSTRNIMLLLNKILVNNNQIVVKRISIDELHLASLHLNVDDLVINIQGQCFLFLALGDSYFLTCQKLPFINSECNSCASTLFFFQELLFPSPLRKKGPKHWKVVAIRIILIFLFLVKTFIFHKKL